MGVAVGLGVLVGGTFVAVAVGGGSVKVGLGVIVFVAAGTWACSFSLQATKENAEIRTAMITKTRNLCVSIGRWRKLILPIRNPADSQ